MALRFTWTDGNDKAFRDFYLITEAYYSRIAGGEENRRQFFIPRGFAHGFRVLSESADFFYKCDNFYTPGDEYGIRWNDPALGIDWRWSAEEATAALTSPKDLAAPALADVPEANLSVYQG